MKTEEPLKRQPRKLINPLMNRSDFSRLKIATVQKPDATGGSLFGEWRDDSIPKITGHLSPRSCDHFNLLNGWGEEDNQVVREDTTIAIDDIIAEIEKLRDEICVEDFFRMEDKGTRPFNYKQLPPKLNLAPTFQLTKLTKVSSPGPSPLPCSPVPSRSPVRLRPELPSCLTPNRKEEADDNQGEEESELRAIRNILSGLDLNKYRKKTLRGGCCGNERQNGRAELNSINGNKSTENRENKLALFQVQSNNMGKTKLRELTELLKCPKSKQDGPTPTEDHSKLNVGSCDNNGSTCESFSLPKRRVVPLRALPTLPSSKAHCSDTLKALSLATPSDVSKSPTVDSNQYEVRTFPRVKVREVERAKPNLIQFGRESEDKPLIQHFAPRPLNLVFANGNPARQSGKSQKDYKSAFFSYKSSPNLSRDIREVGTKSNFELSSRGTSSVRNISKSEEMGLNTEPVSTPQQKRYSKKKLRGPYGEMLEEEMRKSGGKPKQNYNQELQILKELCETQIPAKPIPEEHLTPYFSGYCKKETKAIEKKSDRNVIKKDENENFEISEIPTVAPGPNFANSSVGIGLISMLTNGRESTPKTDEDTRTHVVRELHCTENSYVDSLEILVNKYMKPLKCSEYLESSLVDDIFHSVPGILDHHKKFLDTLSDRLDGWDLIQTVGDIFIQTFSQHEVIDIYTAFINNWKSARDRIKTAAHTKPAFARFLEHMSREHKGKLTLDALFIMPVQRIPRYELLIKISIPLAPSLAPKQTEVRWTVFSAQNCRDCLGNEFFHNLFYLKELLKHTSSDHPDYQLLISAQKEVHGLAVKINKVEQETVQQEQMVQKLKEIESLIDGAIDLVQPDRVFISYDLVSIPVGFGIKKDRGLFLFSDLLLVTSIKRRSGTTRKCSSPINSPSLCGFLEMNKYKLLMKFPLDGLDIIKNVIIDDLERKTLAEIDHLEDDLSVLGQISDLLSTLKTHHLELDEAIRDLQSNVSKQLVERQTGDMQLLTVDLNVTTLEGVERITLIFPTCEKRITWENAFVEAKQKFMSAASRTPTPEFYCSVPVRKTRAGLQFTCATSTLGSNQYGYRDVWVCNSDGYVGQVCILSLQPEPTVTSCNGICNARILCIVSVPAFDTTTNSTDQPLILNDSVVTYRQDHVKRDSWLKISNGNIHLESDSSEEEDNSNYITDDLSERQQSLNELSIQDGSRDRENHQPTMWLGTEDGCILVYSCNENIRIKKTKNKLQHSSPVFCLVYLEDQIFASLANGELIVYTRKESRVWNFEQPQKLQVGNSMSPVRHMIAADRMLWCGCQNYVKVLNTANLQIEYSFQVTHDSSKCIISMVLSAEGVWIALQFSPIIFLYHATTCEYLMDVSVVPAVSRMLAGCDDIIQQHKSACLRVTSLLACKDLLWIGTSAGVVLTMHLSCVTSVFGCSDNVNIVGISQGHTGHVRFLTTVNMEQDQDSSRNLYTQDNYYCEDSINRSAMVKTNKLLVISGGDGYEVFQNGINETAGHDDSTNHLLLWKV